jgi:hypothetical protein
VSIINIIYKYILNIILLLTLYAKIEGFNRAAFKRGNAVHRDDKFKGG